MDNQADKSYLDNKYFIDRTVYNCPFCNRNNLPYSILDTGGFDWSKEKYCWYYIVECSYCDKQSLHLSYQNLAVKDLSGEVRFSLESSKELDKLIFYSQPTSFFVMDNRIPKQIREPISEAEGCLKLNYLLAASACVRKSIYELLEFENAEGGHYEDKIKSLKEKIITVVPEFFDALNQIKDIMDDQVHENSKAIWDAKTIWLILDVLKEGLHEIYVLPDERRDRRGIIDKLKKHLVGEKPKAQTDDSNDDKE